MNDNSLKIQNLTAALQGICYLFSLSYDQVPTMQLSDYLIVFALCVLTGMALVSTQHLHGKFSLDSTFGVQKFHTEPTPRIGGVVISTGLIVAWWLATPDVRALLSPMLMAGTIAFAFGLAEDITKKVGVLPRLLATMTSGVVVSILSGVAMQRTGLPALDWLLQFTPLAVLFTAFAVGGVANAINIIDGFNGLAAGAVVTMLVAMGLIALRVGDVPLATVCFISATVVMGFNFVNWPLGKLFLGDGGAYLTGFVLAWLAVLLPMRNPPLNAWVTLLVCAYPVLEVAFSFWRRHKREGHSPTQPDKMHLHHLVFGRVVRPLFPNSGRTIQNGMTSPFCWLMVALPAGLAVVFMNNTPALVASFVLSGCAYASVYTRLSKFRWSFWR